MRVFAGGNGRKSDDTGVLGEVLDGARFADSNHFASYNGTAPIEWDSGGSPGPFFVEPGRQPSA